MAGSDRFQQTLPVLIPGRQRSTVNSSGVPAQRSRDLTKA